MTPSDGFPYADETAPGNFAFKTKPKGDQMTEAELEDAIRELCDGSGLNNGQLAGVLDALKAGYQMLVEEGEE